MRVGLSPYPWNVTIKRSQWLLRQMLCGSVTLHKNRNVSKGHVCPRLKNLNSNCQRRTRTKTDGRADRGNNLCSFHHSSNCGGIEKMYRRCSGIAADHSLPMAPRRRANKPWQTVHKPQTKATRVSCSKLTTLLVNDSLKFTISDTQICWIFLLKKCE